MNLEEILQYIDQSDDDVDPNLNTQSKQNKNKPTDIKDVDYSEIYNYLIRDNLPNDSESHELADSSATDNTLTVDKNENNLEDSTTIFNKENFISGFISELPLESSIASISPDALDNKITSKFDNDLDLSESLNIATDANIVQNGSSQEDSGNCQCDEDTKQLIDDATKDCGELFSYVKHCVGMQLSEWNNKHKLHLIQKLRKKRGRLKESADKEDEWHTSDERDANEDLTPYISKNHLNSLGLPSNTLLEDPQSNKMTIRCRHKLSGSLELLKIFDDRFYAIDDSSINRMTKASTNLLTPTCICTSTDLLLFGTMCGSVFISEFSTYNFERKFCSYNEYEALDTTVDSMNWYEIDCEKGLSVTSLDVLPNTGWITVGYNDGTVKLLQNFKVSRGSKSHTGGKTEGPESRSTDTRTFGLMADAVSSAFSGIKKTNSQTICSTDVFNDSVLNCKFTFSESYEEIICSNLRSIAILTYSKNVLSHNLNVNYLQSLNERLENDQIVDIVCLSSNPQAKFITGADAGGICAILTLKSCLIFSTRPRLSILINVSLEKTGRTAVPEVGISQVPSVTWMIFNSGKKNIKPVLLISMGNQIRFIQCNLQTVKGSLSMNVSSLGTMQFKHTIRAIRIVTRLILAIVDGMNVLHIVQVNLTGSPMYYDVVRSLDLTEFSNKMELGIEVFDPVWLIQTSLLPTITVSSKTVKMMAKGYKKFSNLISDMFQGKKHTSSFELKNFTILILVPNGMLGIEMNSWIKVIGELSASKLFCEGLAIIQALSEEWVPGLYDFKAFKNNLSQLVLYILHQSSAHIIKLSKFVSETANISTNLLNLDSEAPREDPWNTKVKSDVYEQVNTLCCSMIDSCVSSRMYEPLNDLIFRCFATINLEHVFVKYILMNLHHGRINLEFLNSQIIESICNTYELVLDDMHKHYLEEQWHVEDEILYIDQIVSTSTESNSTINNNTTETSGNGEMKQTVKSNENENVCRYIAEFAENQKVDGSDYLLRSFQFDPRILVYHIVCNNLCKIQLYCFRNNVITQTSKALSRISRHYCWHCLIYCNSVVLDDYSNVLDIMLSHICTKCMKIQEDLISVGRENEIDECVSEHDPRNLNEEGKLDEKKDKGEGNELQEEQSEEDEQESLETTSEEDEELESGESWDIESKELETKENDEKSVAGRVGEKKEVILPMSVSENLFAIRVLFLTLESFMTFENCGLTDNIDVSSYCNLMSYLCATGNFKPSFPIESKALYTREVASQDEMMEDQKDAKSQKFPHDFNDVELTPIYKLLTISPRLFFVCILNLFTDCTDKFAVHSNIIGSKISTFNFVMNVVVSAIYKLEEKLDDRSTRMMKNMAAFLFLRASSGAGALWINLNTAAVAMYTLLTEKKYEEDCKRRIQVGCEASKELIHHEGYFNDTYFYNVFHRRDEEFDQEPVMSLNKRSVEKAIRIYVENYVRAVSTKIKCASDLGENKQFAQLARMCRKLLNLTTGSLRFFFYQITGDFEVIIGEYESFNREESVFTYLERCIEYIRTSNKTAPEKIDHLLLMDAKIRKSFVRAILKNLQKLIKLDLSKVTNLLIQLFSLMEVIRTLDATMEMSPETMLNTLKTLPDLQILVLDALLKSKSNTGNMLQLPNSYFNRYLNLLSIHDKANVANFLKRQKSLNITYCLNVCRRNGIEDAVIYLLLRAGNVEEAVQLLLVSFEKNIGDAETRSSLIATAHSICQDYHNQISYEIIERMWFTMLQLSVECLNSGVHEEVVDESKDRRVALGFPDKSIAPEGVAADALSATVVEIFNNGILKYVKFPNALTEVIKYKASLSIFKSPLNNLLSDFQLQTYIVNSASTISKIIMNKEFRQSQVFSNRGVVISTINRNANINRNLICPVCSKNLIYNLHADAELMLKPEKHARKTKGQYAEESKISPFEEQIGVLSSVPIQGERAGAPAEAPAIISNIYNDRLSTFITKRGRVLKPFSQTQNLGLYPPIIQTIAKDADSFRRDPIIVYWCTHSFHQHCAPDSCPICNIKE
ncbi:hypothetical protein MACJ_000205 [Theileria orientalis]|uniref:Vacuolar protein sorting-associated protein 8 central domain-containing protein n=1 Tax=Theileria orientalis TaxID=68886 RepID=A0A976QPN5_THEOR|nr:hypothetical protein MACJ_000205 [Theileria orientalis]